MALCRRQPQPLRVAAHLGRASSFQSLSGVKAAPQQLQRQMVSTPSDAQTARLDARRVARGVLAFCALLVLAGCARHYTAEAANDPYGFFSGIWHGLIFPYALLANLVSWLLSLVGVDFLSSVQIIGRPNTGFLFYYLGFFLGLCTYASGAASR